MASLSLSVAIIGLFLTAKAAGLLVKYTETSSPRDAFSAISSANSRFLILDNYSTPRSAAVQRWLITDKMIRRATFHSVDELERAIYAWFASALKTRPRVRYLYEKRVKVGRAGVFGKMERPKALSSNG